jgi:hypothetical protein
MYKEQAWVEKLLKRLRNEADTQSQSIHKFLVDNLLAMHTDVLAAVGNLRKTVQELAAKTDKTVRHTTSFGWFAGPKVSPNRMLLYSSWIIG